VLGAIGVLSQDVRHSLRRLRAAPLFTVFAIVTLAFGIGITTAVYSYLNAFRQQAPGVRDADELVHVVQSAGRVWRLTGPEFEELRAHQQVFSGFAAWTTITTSLATQGDSQLVTGEAVSGDFFQTLGVGMVAGRPLTPADDRDDAPPVAVLSDAFWRTRFGRDPAAVGQSIRLAGRNFVVVGVADKAFQGPAARPPGPSVWVPLAVAPGAGPNRTLALRDPRQRELYVFARLAPGVTLEAAHAQIGPVVARLEAVSPGTSEGGQPRRVSVLRAYPEPDPAQRSSDGSNVLLALPALVLLVACTNLANLVLSRGMSRQHDFAVRRTLGASRGRLIREQLIEGAIVALAAGAGGLLVADRAIAFVTAAVRDSFGSIPAIAGVTPELDARVMAAAGGCALLALLISSLVPAVQLARGSDRQTLSADPVGGNAPRWRGRANLIALQVGVSVGLFLVTAAGISLLQSDRHQIERTGLDRAAIVSVPFGLQQRDEAHVRQVVNQLMAASRTLPGVQAVAVTGMWNDLSSSLSARLSAADRADRPGVPYRPVLLTPASPELFDLLGIEPLQGRAIADADSAGSQPVIVLNQSLVVETFGPGEHLGREVLVRRERDGTLVGHRLVGIVPDRRLVSDRIERDAYVPFSQQFTPNVSILARSASLSADALAAHMRLALSGIDPDAAVTFAGRAELAGRWLPGVAIGMLVSAVAGLATLALVFAMTGLYGVLLHVVSRRTREFGVRLALGADRRDVARLVLRDGLRPVLEGLAIGLGVASVLRMYVQGQIVTKTIPIFDPVAFGLAAGPLLIAAAIACYIPAWRASRVDPNVTLRHL